MERDPIRVGATGFNSASSRIMAELQAGSDRGAAARYLEYPPLPPWVGMPMPYGYPPQPAYGYEHPIQIDGAITGYPPGAGYGYPPPPVHVGAVTSYPLAYPPAPPPAYGHAPPERFVYSAPPVVQQSMKRKNFFVELVAGTLGRLLLGDMISGTIEMAEDDAGSGGDF